MFLIFVFCISHVWSHSWIHCVDYDIDASLKVDQIRSSFCSAWARGIDKNAIFGQDYGFNYQPKEQQVCRDPYDVSRVISLKIGQKIRILWPAKNHVAASCTNPYIKDQSLRLYAYPVQDLKESDPSWSVWRKDQYLVYDFSLGKGFQNCPDFCPTTDRVPCFGDVVIPENITKGWNKFLWAWNFNPGEWYTTCFDTYIDKDNEC